MSRFLSARFAALEAYTPGEQPQDMEYVKLNTNESPFPPSPEVIAAVSAAEVGKLNLYPDPECKRLRKKLAALYGVGEENVFLSNGSDDILNFFFMAFCDAERPVAFPNISYGFYPVYAQLYNLPATVIPLGEDFSLNAEDYRAGERTFQILTQAVGRAGRKDKKGTAVIQTYQPDHYSIRAAAIQDYPAFYEEEIGYRELMNYPPAHQLLAIHAACQEEERLEQAMDYIRRFLLRFCQDPQVQLIGPARESVAKISDLYRYVPLEGTTAEIQVCSGDMLFNAFDAYLEFLR